MYVLGWLPIKINTIIKTNVNTRERNDSLLVTRVPKRGDEDEGIFVSERRLLLKRINHPKVGADERNDHLKSECTK